MPRTISSAWRCGCPLHGPDRVLEELRRLCERAPLEEEMPKQLAYLQKRKDRMQYPLYQQDGWPLGSGIVESANKVVMQARLKGAGMHWAPSHVNPLLALRTAACNDRWDEAQSQLRTYRREQRSLRQQQRVLQRQRQQFYQTLLKRITQCPPEPALPPPPIKKPSSGYSWRQPFLRQPPRAKI